MDTILVVEDEQDIADLVTLNLQEIGLTVDPVSYTHLRAHET